MDLSRRLIGASAIVSADGKVTDVDISGLIRRLLLFDKYVLVSVRLQEFPVLVRYFGYEGLRELLSANLIEIRCECLQLTQTAQSGIFGDPVLPPFFYQFHWIDAHDREKYIHDCLQDIHGLPNLGRKQVQKLKKEIVDAIRPLPAEIKPQLFPPFQEELLHNPSLLKTSIGMVVHKHLGLDRVPFSVSVHQEAENTFRVESDLPQRAGVGEAEAHKLVEAGLMGIAGLSQSIGEMRAYSALCGFRDEELPLFRHKLDFLADTVSSQSKEHNFQRVINIAGLPHFQAMDEGINVERLLEIRESSEAREFRDWLGGIGRANDEEIRERVAGFRDKAGLKIDSKAGGVERVLATNYAGVVPGEDAAGLALSVFNRFLFEEILPKSGIAAFVNDFYPSIFERPEKQ